MPVFCEQKIKRINSVSLNHLKAHIVRVRISKRIYHACISTAEAKRRNISCVVAVQTE
jgi:hypothetical protein